MKRFLMLLAFLLTVNSLVYADYVRSEKYKGPSFLRASADGKFLYLVESDAAKVVQIDPATNQITKEFSFTDMPTCVAISADGAKIYVTTANPWGFLHCMDVASGNEEFTVPVGHGTEHVCLHPNGKIAYVCNRFSNYVSVVDLEQKKEIKQLQTLREPVSADVTPDGKTLFVANYLPLDPSDGIDVAAEVSWFDTETYEGARIRLPNGCVSLHEVRVSPDGKYAFVTNNLGRYQMPTTQVERGWMNTNGVAILDAQKRSFINEVLLDNIDLGAANPWGVAMTADGSQLIVSHAGTKEISIIDAPKMFEKLQQIADGTYVVERKGNRSFTPPTPESVPNDLSFLVKLRIRVKLDGMGPRSVVVLGDKVYVPAYFSDSICIVDRIKGKQVDSIQLTPNFDEIFSNDVVRYGEMTFNDGTVCFQQWQSCASCHPYARMDGLNWDLMNDGMGNPKNAKPLLYSHETPPTMISGIRKDAPTCVRSGFKHILFSVRPEKDPAAIDEYLKSMKAVPSPHLVNGELSEAAKRGKEIFERVKCGVCHDPEWYYTDMQMHDVDTKNEKIDRRRDFDTPTLCEVWRTPPYLHDGRYTTMFQLFKEGQHGKQKGDVDKLTDDEIRDLCEFVLSL